MPKHITNNSAGTDQEPAEPDRNAITHKPICPACSTRMIRIYIRDYVPGTTNHGRTYKGIGWICPECEHVMRD